VAAQTDSAVEIAAKSKKKNWAVSTATVVEGLLRLFSSNPKRDRDLMHRKAVGKGRERKLLADKSVLDKTPLRGCYLACNDLLIFTLVKNYFNAVSDVLWQANGRSYIRKTVGVQALFDVLRIIGPKNLVDRDVSTQFFSKMFTSCKQIDFSDDFFQASGTGRQRIRNTLEISLGLRQLAAVNEGEVDSYKRLCRL